ncbi:MAG: hypothetical protein AB8I08_37385 [Sandaracinaceae bacterium]
MPTQPLRATLLLALPLSLAFRCDMPPPADAGAPATDAQAAMHDSDAGAGVQSDVESCVIYEIQRRECYRNAGSNATLVDIWSCAPGRSCERPEGYSVSRDAIMCVDSWRYRQARFPATCEEVEAFEAGDLECLTAEHCAGGDARDWICDGTRRCVCPDGGDCPVAEPVAPPGGAVDGGVDAGSVPDAGPAPMPDGGPPPAPDAGPPGPAPSPPPA